MIYKVYIEYGDSNVLQDMQNLLRDLCKQLTQWRQNVWESTHQNLRIPLAHAQVSSLMTFQQ